MPKITTQCPLGGDENNKCSDCIYSAEYHFENGKCIKNKIKKYVKDKSPKIAFDIDGTLITAESNPKPREEVINLLRAFNKLGWDIYVHSGGGILYAKRWVERLGLDTEMHINIAIKGTSTILYDIAVDDCINEKEWTDKKEGYYIKANLFIKV